MQRDLEKLFSKYSFHPVIHLPAKYEILDLSSGYSREANERFEYSIGKYNERRLGMYTTELFTGDSENIRDVHVGIDIGAPVGTPIHAFDEGEIFCATINALAGDYGGTIITQHTLEDLTFWVLHGHLSHSSARRKKAGEKFKRGDVLATVGSFEENGGWNPHLHFQISLDQPTVCDMPGAVTVGNREKSLKNYPDPRLILGKIF